MEATKFACLIIIASSGVAVSHGAKWSYTGELGPKNWHELFPKDCSGKHQSPIDIRPEETLYNPDLRSFAIWYDPPKKDSRMYIINNGHTVQVNLDGDFYVSNAGLPNVYKAIQFHFHWGHKAHHGSEHLIDGKASPIEMHLVTYNKELYLDIGQAVTHKGGLAVLGVMYEISREDNPALATVIDALKDVRDPEDTEKADLPLTSLRDFLPEDISRYYRYNGSLTTPGCFESVIWTVFDDRQTISHKQLREFTTLLQFKHKQVHGKRAGESRHRRSLTRTERENERRAGYVLDELGVRDNKYEENLLKSELLQDQMIMAHMPQQEVVINIPEPSRKSRRDPKLEDQERAGKKNASTDNQDVVNDTPTGRTEGSHLQHEQEVIEAENFYIQEAIVNNFRPVQPLNDRLVYRSFKLRPAYGQASIDKKENGAGHHRLSTATIVAVFVLSFIFV